MSPHRVRSPSPSHSPGHRLVDECRSPTAITLAQITSSASGDVFEKLISRTLFLSYAILTYVVAALSSGTDAELMVMCRSGPCTIALVLAALFIAKYDVASP